MSPLWPTSPSLTYLELGDNQISDISPLQNLTNLTGLYLRKITRLALYQPLQNLTNLIELYLDYNQTSNVSPLQNLTILGRDFHSDNNQISDISASAEPHQPEIPLSSNTIRLAISLLLQNLTNLREIFLYSNNVSDIYPLVNNPGLGAGAYITLGNNPLNSYSIHTYLLELRMRGVKVDY